jgi:hypothetical protein
MTPSTTSPVVRSSRPAPAAPVKAKSSLAAPIPEREDWPGFLLTALEFGLLVVIIRLFEIESQRFGELMAWAWGGFIVNHFLPARLRLPFFVALSIWCLYVVAGGSVAVCVVLGGLTLLGICHLPIAFSLRVLMIVGVGAVVGCLRVGSITDRINVAAWAILGSMFMLRITVYLYDLKHNNAEFSLFRGMAYFFMLPNVCFLFFPVVDYKTFSTSHFSDTPVRIYQVGVRWIFRGVIHLLLYRVVNQLGTTSPLEAATLGGVVWFMLTMFLSYLKISGQFHIIVGLLHMFGFKLPETHHLWLLSSSFTDLWRRMNIYWKDYLAKILFFPVFYKLKGFGITAALALSTLLVFVATWFLHGYQYFWIRGSFDYTWQNGSLGEESIRLGKSLVKAFNFTPQDALFWSILAVLVVANTLYEAKKGRRRTLTKPRRTLKSDIGLALGTIGTITILCSLWTLWYTRWFEFRFLVAAATNTNLTEVAAILAGLVGLGLAAILVNRLDGIWAPASQEQLATRSSVWSSIATVAVPCCILLLIGYLDVPARLEASPVGELLTAIKQDQQLNPEEIDQLHRGYYEELDVARRDEKLNFLRMSVPKDWCSTSAFQHDAGYFDVKELTPGYKNPNYHGKPLSINRWGMRDRDTYEKDKPPGVYRIALFGSSHEFGSGVSDEEVFDNLVEDQLSAETGRRYEILNFAQPADSSFRHLARLTLRPTVMQFQPDAVLVFVNERELKLTLTHLASVVAGGVEVPPEWDTIREVFHEAQVTPDMPSEVMFARLLPLSARLLGYAYGKFADFSHKTGIPVYIVFRPSVVHWARRQAKEEIQKKDLLFTWAREAGLPTIDLSDAFDGVKNRRRLMVEPFDDHMNAEAHHLLAACLFKKLHNPDGTLIFDAGVVAK